MEDMGKEQFVGTWKLISFEFRRSDGAVSYPLGQNPAGMIMYAAQGYMSGHVMRRDRPAFVSGDPLQGSAEEIQTALEGYMAYCGTYDVNDQKGTIAHILECSLFPNWVGTIQTRFFECSENRLLLTTPPLMLGGQQQIVHVLWERMA